MPLTLKRFSTLLIICCCLVLLASISPATKVHITILYTNDVHGHVLPFDNVYQGQEEKNVAGAARRATLIKQIRSENPHTLVLDAGDLLSGTPVSGFFK
ncbi:MAG: bifunctional metallophosphatase/5'-nucleotidase, partial [bacterium]